MSHAHHFYFLLVFGRFTLAVFESEVLRYIQLKDVSIPADFVVEVDFKDLNVNVLSSPDHCTSNALIHYVVTISLPKVITLGSAHHTFWKVLFFSYLPKVSTLLVDMLPSLKIAVVQL